MVIAEPPRVSTKAARATEADYQGGQAMMPEPERPSTAARPSDEGKATEIEYHSSGRATEDE
jgi:hypothetical protein